MNRTIKAGVLRPGQQPSAVPNVLQRQNGTVVPSIVSSGNGSGEIPLGDIENLPVDTTTAMVLLDRARHIRLFTPGATALFSFLPSDVGRPIQDLSQKFHDTTLLSDILLVLDGKSAARKEVQAADGRWFMRQALPYLLRDGTVEGAVVTFSDIDADALQELRSYAETIVNTVREPLVVLDADLRVYSINQSFAALFQVSSPQVIGQALHDLDKGIWEVPELLSQLRAVLEHSSPMEEFEVPYDSATLGLRTLVLNARTLRRGGGRADLILVAIDDVTERRRLDLALKVNEVRQREEERVWQRQLEVNSAMRVSTVGELAAGLAHELNQPLSSISNLVGACAEHVRGGSLSPTRHLELLAEIANESQRAAGIVAHLRSFIDKGKPEFERIDLVEIVGRVPQMLRRELEHARVTLRMDLPTQPLCVDADAIQIEQVLVNLIQNAVHSIREADRADRVIELRVRSVDGMGEVDVRDTGTGVSAAVAERMFEAFFTTKSDGLGMGLALSRSILEAHRGRMWTGPPQSGGGAVVRFAIPLNPSTRHGEALTP